MSAKTSAIRYITGSKPSQHGRVLLSLRVKPGASKVRQGLTKITDEAIEMCVAAQPRDGEANKAVVSLLSDVLDVPKSRIELTSGSSKSRDKMVVLHNVNDEADFQEIYETLKKSVE